VPFTIWSCFSAPPDAGCLVEGLVVSHINVLFHLVQDDAPVSSDVSAPDVFSIAISLCVLMVLFV
jgi:hypothetical protein